MPLPEEKRRQLDSIVLDMGKKNAPQKDVDAVVNDFINKYQGQSAPVIHPKKDLLQKTGNVVNAVFPGKQVGQAIGTLGGLAFEKAKGILGGQDNSSTFDTSAPKPKQVLGDIAQGALTVAAPNIGNGATALGRIGANTALGAGLGASNAVAQDKGLGGIAKDAAIGGATGAAVSTATEGIKSLTQNLPKWLTKMALPKLDNKNLDYAVENTRIGSLKAMQSKSGQAIREYEGSVQNILNQPKLKAVPVDSKAILGNSLSNFPNSDYTSSDLIKNAKNIAPKVGKLLDKFEKGTANIQEINTIRKELDAATKSVYTSLNRPPEAKLLGATLADSMRTFVKTTAPETVPIFEDFSKEIGLNKAITAAVKKGEQKITFKDLIAGGAGFSQGGLTGALKAIIAERVLLNPAAQVAGAKLIQGASNIAAPVGNAIVQGGKAPLVKGLTNN